MDDRQHPRSIPSRPGQVTNSNPNRLWEPDPQRRTLSNQPISRLRNSTKY